MRGFRAVVCLDGRTPMASRKRTENKPPSSSVTNYALLASKQDAGQGPESQRFRNPKRGVPPCTVRYKIELLCLGPKPLFEAGVPFAVTQCFQVQRQINANSGFQDAIRNRLSAAQIVAPGRGDIGPTTQWQLTS